MIVLGQKIEAEPVRCQKCGKAAPLYMFRAKKICRFCLESMVVDKMDKQMRLSRRTGDAEKD